MLCRALDGVVAVLCYAERHRIARHLTARRRAALCRFAQRHAALRRAVHIMKFLLCCVMLLRCAAVVCCWLDGVVVVENETA